MAGRGYHRVRVLDRRGIENICWISSVAVLVCGVVSSTTFPGDVTALQAVKNSLVDSSNSLSTWGGGDPCDGWVGVYCISGDYPSDLTASNFSHVTELRLPNLNLKGSLAAEIGNFSALKYLNLMWNQISGSIPPPIAKLKNLSFLLLSGNQLSGALPREVGFLPSLVRMQIDENNLSGQIPDTFAYPYLRKVQHIQLSSNSLDGGIPVGLTNLTTIQYLLLDSNNFTGNLPVIASMPNLVIVQLDNNNFDSIPEQFGTLPNLVRLSLRNCSLRGGIPDFSGSSSLAVIDLSHNSLTGFISNATKSANLTTVDLSYNSLSGTVPVSVGSLLSLQILELRGNRISGQIPSNLSSNVLHQSIIFDFQNNLITSVANKTNLLGVTGPDGNITAWLSGNPFCGTSAPQQNNALCVPRDIAAYVDIGGVISAPMASTYQNTCSASCETPYALATVSQPNDCRCAAPITVQWQLLSPSFYLFDHHIQQKLQAYLGSGLYVDVNQIQIQSYVYQPGFKLLFTILVFPPGAQFDDSEAARIYSVFANLKLPSSTLFGPYDMISFSFPAMASNGKSSGLPKGTIAGIVVGVLAFVVLKSLCMYYMLKYWLTWKSREKREKSEQKFCRKQSTFKKSFSGIKVASVKEFTFDEIAKATDYFSDERLVGEGGYGKVYSGTLEDGQKVAVKRAEEGSHQGSLEFETEIQLLSRVHHKNLVALIGYCNDQGEQLLVYEFVAYGSLSWHLSAAARVPLTFLTRLQIALDSARGIHYLHTQANPPIFHRDIKASNILLDEQFHGKVSDLGLSKVAPQPDLGGMVGYVSTVVKGTPGYLDPEYFKTHRLTDKSDVYSFGVVLLVLVTGEQPISDGKNLVREVNSAYDEGALARVVDLRIRGSYSHRAMDMITRLALVCCRDNPDERPTIGEVVTQLEELWKETYYESAEDANTPSAYSGDLRNDCLRSEDSLFELDPSKDSSPNSSTVWSSSGNPESGGSVPNINIVNPR